MGAWGVGILDDDAALDALDELKMIADPREHMLATFEAALAADYVEYDAGQAVLVSTAVIALIVNGRPPNGFHLVDGDGDIESWLAGVRSLDLTALIPRASAACLKVVNDESELKELWLENEADGEVWQQQGMDLIHHLSPAA